MTGADSEARLVPEWPTPAVAPDNPSKHDVQSRRCSHSLEHSEFAEVRDVDLALDIVRRDQELNELNREVFRLAIELGDDIDTREWLMTMTMVARAFERIGDNAVDIGEQVAFVVEGMSPEFGDRAARLASGCDVNPPSDEAG